MNTKELLKRIKEGTLEGHKQTMIDMSKQSQKECPVDKGPLRESYKVDINGENFIEGNKNGEIKILKDIKQLDSNNISSEASYTAPYVIYQHEDMTLNHPTPGTKAKFLEDPVKKIEKKYKENIIKAIKESIK